MVPTEIDGAGGCLDGNGTTRDVDGTTTSRRGDLGGEEGKWQPTEIDGYRRLMVPEALMEVLATVARDVKGGLGLLAMREARRTSTALEGGLGGGI